MLSSPRRPPKTIRIFSSAEYCLRVARRMSLTTFSAVSFAKLECCLIFAPVNATMSQKHSLLQSAQFVPRVLTVDTPKAKCDLFEWNVNWCVNYINDQLKTQS